MADRTGVSIKNSPGNRAKKDLGGVADEGNGPGNGTGQEGRNAVFLQQRKVDPTKHADGKDADEDVGVNKREAMIVRQESSKNSIRNDQHYETGADHLASSPTVREYARRQSRDGTQVNNVSGKFRPLRFIHAENLNRIQGIVVQRLVTTISTDNDGRLGPDQRPGQHSNRATKQLAGRVADMFNGRYYRPCQRSRGECDRGVEEDHGTKCRATFFIAELVHVFRQKQHEQDHATRCQ